MRIRCSPFLSQIFLRLFSFLIGNFQKNGGVDIKLSQVKSERVYPISPP